jgi:hypothetical protein
MEIMKDTTKESGNLIDIEEVVPDPAELEIIKAYKSGNPDYQPFITQDELLKEIEL